MHLLAVRSGTICVADLVTVGEWYERWRATAQGRPSTLARDDSYLRTHFLPAFGDYDAIDQWAFCSLKTSSGCRDFYDQHRAAGDLHHQALRALANRLVGYLHGCLRTRTPYNEHTAWNHRQQTHDHIAA